MPGKFKVWAIGGDGPDGFDVELFTDEAMFNLAHMACATLCWNTSIMPTLDPPPPMPDDPVQIMATLSSALGFIAPFGAKAFELDLPTGVMTVEDSMDVLGSAMAKFAPDLAHELKRRWEAQKSGKPIPLPTLAIILEGGIVQSVVSDQPDIASRIERVVVIDYDTEGASEEDVSYVKQHDDDYSDACIFEHGIQKAKIDLANILDHDPALDCRICGDTADDGEGFDGMCGSCADQAEERGAKTAGLAAIAGMWIIDSSYLDKAQSGDSLETLRATLREAITDWVEFCDINKIDYSPEDPPHELTDEEKAEQYALSNGLEGHPSAAT